METKTKLRAQFKNRRLALNPEDKEELDQQLCEQFFEHIPLDELSTLHTFLPIQHLNEPNVTLIAQRIRDDYPNIRLVVSRTLWQERAMEHVYYAHDLVLKPSKQGIMEPIDGKNCLTKSIDAVLVPLLAFDDHGHRLGYGAGFYDRFLAECAPATKRIGISYFEVLDRPIPEVDPYDIRLTHCITPNRYHRFD